MGRRLQSQAGAERSAAPDPSTNRSRAPILYTVHLSHISLKFPRNLLTDFGDVAHVAAPEAKDWLIDAVRLTLLYSETHDNFWRYGVVLTIACFVCNEKATTEIYTIFRFKTHAENESLYNTPPTYGIYIAGLVFQWLTRQGGVAGIEKQNVAKAKLLYECIDASSLYESRVEKACRSRMNVPFYLRDERLNDAFLDGAKAAGLLQLKGHKSVGGMRASIYNAISLASVQVLVDYMREFERSHG